MANQKISQLPSGTNAQAGDLFVIARGGANLALTTAQLFNAPSVAATFASLAVSGNGVLQTINGSASAFTEYRIGGVSQARVGTQNFATGDLSLLTLTSAPVVFGTNNTERMRLDASGNLGLGVTPSAWWSGSRTMQIGQGATFEGRTASNIASVSSNSFINSSGVEAYINTAAATKYNQGVSGDHRWYVASSGTAGNPITFTQAMTLDANGNLGVGTTTASQRLSVTAVSASGFAGARIQNNNGGTGLAGVELSSDPTYAKAAIALARADVNGVGRVAFFVRDSTDASGWAVADERFSVKPKGQVRFIPLAAAPGGAEDGDVYYDSGTNKLRVRAGGAWVDLH